MKAAGRRKAVVVVGVVVIDVDVDADVERIARIDGRSMVQYTNGPTRNGCWSWSWS